MKKGLMLIVLVAGLCGITKAQAQVEEVIIEQRLPGYKTSFEANPFWHNWFVSANFGANAFFAEHSSQAKFKNTITFMPELAVGKMFNPGGDYGYKAVAEHYTVSPIMPEVCYTCIICT